MTPSHSFIHTAQAQQALRDAEHALAQLPAPNASSAAIGGLLARIDALSSELLLAEPKEQASIRSDLRAAIAERTSIASAYEQHDETRRTLLAQIEHARSELARLTEQEQAQAAADASAELEQQIAEVQRIGIELCHAYRAMKRIQNRNRSIVGARTALFDYASFDIGWLKNPMWSGITSDHVIDGTLPLKEKAA